MNTAIYTIDASKRIHGIVIEETRNADGPAVTLAEAAGSVPFIVCAPVSDVPSPGYATINTSRPMAVPVVVPSTSQTITPTPEDAPKEKKKRSKL